MDSAAGHVNLSVLKLLDRTLHTVTMEKPNDIVRNHCIVSWTSTFASSLPPHLFRLYTSDDILERNNKTA